MGTLLSELKQRGGEGVLLLELAMNPDSFAQTIENLFSLSFLVSWARGTRCLVS